MGKDDDLPPGVHGPVPNPHDVAKASQLNAEGTFPIYESKSKINVLPHAFKMLMLSFDVPATAIRSCLDKFRGENPGRWYHKKFRKVPDIWECEKMDLVCSFEAEAQFKKDKLVEYQIVEILKDEQELCKLRNPITYEEHCKGIISEFLKAKEAFMIKYADLGSLQTAKSVLNKQKNRFIEKRYKDRVGIEDNGRPYLPGPMEDFNAKPWF